MRKGRVVVYRDRGDVSIVLRAMGALPIEGVLSNLKGQIIEPNPRDDESVVIWTLPFEDTSGCVFYGVVTPLGNIWRAPKYERFIAQGDDLVAGVKNPARTKTRKINPGEWVGPPEALRFVKK